MITFEQLVDLSDMWKSQSYNERILTRWSPISPAEPETSIEDNLFSMIQKECDHSFIMAPQEPSDFVLIF